MIFLLLKLLSRFVSFPSKEQVSFNFMAAVKVYSDFGGQENKICHCFHCFPIYWPWSDGTRGHDLSFLNVEFQANFLTLLFHALRRLSSSSLLSDVRVVSSEYLRLLIFLPAILILACDSSSQVFCMMYAAQKLNKHSDNIQPWLLYEFWTSPLFHVWF